MSHPITCNHREHTAQSGQFCFVLTSIVGYLYKELQQYAGQLESQLLHHSELSTRLQLQNRLQTTELADMKQILRQAIAAHEDSESEFRKRESKHTKRIAQLEEAQQEW